MSSVPNMYRASCSLLAILPEHSKQIPEIQNQEISACLSFCSSMVLETRQKSRYLQMYKIHDFPFQLYSLCCFFFFFQKKNSILAVDVLRDVCHKTQILYSFKDMQPPKFSSAEKAIEHDIESPQTDIAVKDSFSYNLTPISSYTT